MHRFPKQVPDPRVCGKRAGGGCVERSPTCLGPSACFIQPTGSIHVEVNDAPRSLARVMVYLLARRTKPRQPEVRGRGQAE